MSIHAYLSPDQSTPAGTPAPRVDASDVVRLLELGLLAHGLRPRPDQNWEAAAGALRLANTREFGWSDVIARASTAVGLQPTVEVLATHELLAAARDAVLVTAVTAPDGSMSWMLVEGNRGRKLKVHTIHDGGDDLEWWEPARVRAALGHGARLWLVLEPARPLERIRSAHIREDGKATAAQRLRALMRLERRDIAVVTVYAVVIGGLSVATPIAVQALVNTVAFGTVLQPLFVLSVLLLAVLAFGATLRSLQAVVVEILQQRLFARTVTDLARRLPGISVATHRKYHAPELVNRFFDVPTLQKAATTLLLDGLGLALTAIVGLLLLAFYHPFLLIFDLVLLGSLTIVIFLLGRGATSTAMDESDAKYQVAGWLEELARHPTLFKSFDASHFAVTKAEVLARDYIRARNKHFGAVFQQLVGGLSVQAIASVALLSVGGWLVITRQLTLGQLVAAELIVAVIGSSFSKVGKQAETVYDTLASLEKLGKLVDLPLERLGGEEPVGDACATLRLRKVRAPGDGMQVSLDTGDVTIHPGEKIAITGDTGSGKSLLLDAVFGLIEPTEGTIELDGVDLRQLHLGRLREHIGLVRDPELIEGTVLENIRLDNPSLGVEEIARVLAKVELDEVIAALPAGLDTKLVPGGAPLSRSQARRLALARIMCGDPRLLLLDGSLDGLGLSDRQLSHVLDELFADDACWSLLVVSDDPRVLERCHRELRLDHGRLQEVSHDAA